MSNIEKLAAAGLIGKGAELSAEEMAAISAMSDMEVGVLLGAKSQVDEPSRESPVPTYHVIF